MNRRVFLVCMGILAMSLLLTIVEGRRLRNGRRTEDEDDNSKTPRKTTTKEHEHSQSCYSEGYSPGKSMDEVTGCVETTEAEYRTFDGKHNLQGPSPVKGAAGTPFVRLLPSDYDDGIGFPKGTDPTKLYNGYPLPLPRSVTLAFNVEGFTETDMHTPWITYWAQFVTHDIVDRGVFKCKDIDCSACDVVNNFCFPIVSPDNDPFFTDKCIPVTRDAPVCDTGKTENSPRQQLNVEVSFHDASVVYGESAEEVGKLRDLTNNLGLLKIGKESGPTGKPYLPQQSEDDELATLKVKFCDPGQRCFVSGDERTQETWGLLSVHTMMFREHNRLATRLHEINPHWGGDKLFMEARKILGGVMQHITYAEFLPVLIGDKTIRDRMGVYKGYDETVTPGAISSFVSGAFRIHNFVKPLIDRLDENFEEIPQGSTSFEKTVGNTNQLVEEGGIDPVVRGMGQPNKDTIDVTHTVFTNDTFLDLPSFDIQRGRSYGIPPYYAWREFCGIDTPNYHRRDHGSPSFNDIMHEITNPNNLMKLEKLYGTVLNVDLWTAGVLEDPANGGATGPTFGCLIAEQFRALRDGDSFYYENPGVFSEEQLNEIRKHSLARISCDNADAIKRVQRNVFLPVKDDSEYLHCSDIPYMDLTAWQEKDTCEPDH